MIQSGRASLVVLSTETPPAAISEVLALEPTDVEHAGTRAPSGRVRQDNYWSLDVETLDNTDEDQTGTRALQVLLARCSAAIGRVVNLPQDCDARIWWFADSDSVQGGFVLPIGLSADIAALGVDVFATVYLNEGD